MKIYKDLYQFTQNLSFMNFTIHQYLLLTEDPVLICTGTYQQAELILPEIKKILGDKRLKYILIPHIESDEYGGLAVFVKEFPDAIIVCSQIGARELPGFGYECRVISKEHGDIIKGNNFSIKCIDYPSEVHLQNGLVFYEEKRNIFFSSDLMLSFGDAAGKVIDSLWKTEINNIGLQNIPNKEKLDAFKKRLNDINPKFIATMHGFCINCE